MTKKDIVRIVSEDLDCSQILVKKIVQRSLDVLIEALVSQGRVELRNFGVFSVKQRKSRIVRNPRTGETMKMEAHRAVAFKAGKSMLEKVNKPVSKRRKKRERN